MLLANLLSRDKNEGKNIKEAARIECQEATKTAQTDERRTHPERKAKTGALRATGNRAEQEKRKGNTRESKKEISLFRTCPVILSIFRSSNTKS